MDQTNLVIIVGALLAVSEALALIPALKSNSVLTLVGNLLKKAYIVLGGGDKK